MEIIASTAPDLTDGFLALGLAAVVSLLTTPVARTLAWRIGAIDRPRARGLHQFPTPRLGGLAILVTVVAAGLVFLPDDHESRGILIGAAVIAVVGATDDILELKADFKLAGQLLAAIVPVASGVRVETATIPFLGDSGSNLLGYLLGTIVVQGALKTNAVVALAFPLVILAVPILDSSFVIAKRIKYGKPIHKADTWHFHHRFANIGFSPRRTTLYLYGWTLTLALLALALRFVPYSDDHGHFNLGWSLVLAAFGLGALAASVYLVLVLEILKLKRWRQFQLRREHLAHGEPPPAEAEVDARLARELETGEFEAVDRETIERERR